jgi:hypothetical protein
MYATFHDWAEHKRPIEAAGRVHLFPDCMFLGEVNFFGPLIRNTYNADYEVQFPRRRNSIWERVLTLFGRTPVRRSGGKEAEPIGF